MDKRFVLAILVSITLNVNAGNLYHNKDGLTRNRNNLEVVDCVSSALNIWEQQVHSEYCNQYVSCMNGIGIVRQCPDGFYFNPVSGVCDYPENVECELEIPSTEPTTESTAETTVDDSTTDETTNDDEFTTDTTNEEDTTTETTNEEDSSTEPTTEEDSTTETTNEEDSTTEETTTETEMICEPLCANRSPLGEEIAHESACNLFISCTDQCYGSTHICPDNLHFNRFFSVCDLPSKAECLLEVCTGAADGVIASVNSCRHYFLCLLSNGQQRKCGNDLVFDAATMACTVEDDSNRCDIQEIPVPPADLKEQCEPLVASQYLRHPEHCDVYYWCVRGLLFPRRCRSGLKFDEVIQACNFEDKVVCNTEM